MESTSIFESFLTSAGIAAMSAAFCSLCMTATRSASLSRMDAASFFDSFLIAAASSEIRDPSRLSSNGVSCSVQCSCTKVSIRLSMLAFSSGLFIGILCWASTDILTTASHESETVPGIHAPACTVSADFTQSRHGRRLQLQPCTDPDLSDSSNHIQSLGR